MEAFIPALAGRSGSRRGRGLLACAAAPWLLATLLCGTGAGSAAAQTVGAPQGAVPQSASAPEVTVTARSDGYSSGLDARSYSLGGDLKSGAGALADVLRDVPSVQVDVEGNVSLRGDSNVTILVDGKPSALFSGPGRAQAIQSMSADQFARVEVMTNPSAGQTAEGSGGIINLISRRPAKDGAAPSASATLKAEVGSGDRYDLGGSGAYAAGALTLNGGLDYRRSGFRRTIETRYAIPDPSTDALSPADQTQAQDQHDDDLTLNGSLGYTLDPLDRLDASVSAESDRQARPQLATYRSDAVSGPLALAYLAPGELGEVFATTAESLTFTRTLPGAASSLSTKLALSQGHDTVSNAAAYSYTAPVQPGLYQSQTDASSFPELDLQIDYKTTLPNKATLALGYEGRFDWQGETDHGVQGASAASATADPDFAERFSFDQQVHALYATYEQAFGKLTVQPGLRVENTTLTTELSSTGQAGRQAYFKLYPSLHVDYALDGNADIKASYGRRVERPDVSQLDPFRVESSLVLYRAGNPSLKPAVTQSWELGYEYRRRTTDAQATLFYRDKSDVFTVVQTDIGGDVLLSTWGNLGERRDAGLELALNRDLLRHLSIKTSVDLQHSEVDAANLGLPGTRTAFVSSGHATLDWQLGAHDFLQLGAQASGRELTAQGYYGGSIFSDLGWRHRFNTRLAAALTAQDPFGLSRRTIATDTPTLVDVQKRKFNYSAAFLGLTYAFGGAPKPADNFSFGDRPAGASQ